MDGVLILAVHVYTYVYAYVYFMCGGGYVIVCVQCPLPWVLQSVVQEFQRKLSDSRRIVVVGNGGIAVELVYVTDHLPISIQ